MTTELTIPVPELLSGWKPSTPAREPHEDGYVERDGTRLYWRRYGDGEPTILLLPTWSIVDHQVWRMQFAYFARHFRVLTFDGRGNGRSDRPKDPAAYAVDQFVDDALAVMDASGTERAIPVSLSAGTMWNLMLCATHPERVASAVFVGPLFPAEQPFPGWCEVPFHERRDSYEGEWDRYNRHYISESYADFVEWWNRKCLPEKHSEKGVEDAVAWGLQTDPQTLLATLGAADSFDVPAAWESISDLFAPEVVELFKGMASSLRCPVLVIEGDRDELTPMHWAKALADATKGDLCVIEGAGHAPEGREPVPFNIAVREFVERDRPRRDPVAHRHANGRPRALYISSPIGLGHARRDVAIARELRELVPELQIDWLAQNPVTKVLEAEGEWIHPASAHLASESGHFESESSEHDLHCFEAFRRMDEVLLANFMVFHDVVREERYDLWIGDEAWELDYYLHEDPSLKRVPYVWLTDFVGAVPMPGDGPREQLRAFDWNEQMIDHVDGLPHVRDRSIFVGNLDDVVEESLGPQLPGIREWTESHFDFAGYVTGFDPAQLGDRQALRAELGYAPDEKVCIVTVGGSGVGESLMRRVVASFEQAKRAVPELRMVAVCGPRIDPRAIPQPEGLELRAYVHDLYRELAACDLAVVQGGLTTAMELTANKRPFLYFPLKHHFEQNVHVRHRLERYGAGRRMDFDDAPPDAIAEAIAQEIGRDVDYRDVETDGARRAAERIAELL